MTRRTPPRPTRPGRPSEPRVPPPGRRGTGRARTPMSEDQGLVAGLVVERLRAWGVQRVFGHSGDGITTVLGAIRLAAAAPAFGQAAPAGTAALRAGGHGTYTGGG